MCLQEAAETVRAAVATLLSQLTKQPLHGPRIVLLLHRLLPPGLVAAIEVTLSPYCCIFLRVLSDINLQLVGQLSCQIPGLRI